MINPEDIKAYRKANDMTQKEFAKLCGVSLSLVRLKWEITGIPTKDVDKAKAITELSESI